MLRLSDLDIIESMDALQGIPDGKVLINTINAHSYNVAQRDGVFAESLNPAHLGAGSCRKYLIPDGISIVRACRWLKAKSQPKERIAGWDLYAFEMQRLNDKYEKTSHCARVMFVGSSERVLEMIRERCRRDYPNLEVVTYSPPYKEAFSEEESREMVRVINDADPDLLWIGMTAPKQEKWTWLHWNEMDIHCHVGTIGAVFDFYAGTARRAPLWWQKHGLEWLYRFWKEPKRMWRRYVVGNPLFVWNIIKEHYGKKE